MASDKFVLEALLKLASFAEELLALCHLLNDRVFELEAEMRLVRAQAEQALSRCSELSECVCQCGETVECSTQEGE